MLAAAWLLIGPQVPIRFRVKSLTKTDTLSLQVKGCALG